MLEFQVALFNIFDKGEYLKAWNGTTIVILFKTGE